MYVKGKTVIMSFITINKIKVYSRGRYNDYNHNEAFVKQKKIELSKGNFTSAYECRFKPFGKIQFDVAVEEWIFRLKQIERDAQMEYGRYKVTEPQGTILSHVPQYKDRQHFCVHLKTYFKQCVL